MKRKTGTRQWAEHNVNCFVGCPNDCRYCYAKKNAVRFKQRSAEEWPDMRYNTNCAKQIRKYSGRVMFPTSHDLPFAYSYFWLPFLTALLKEGNDVLIVTKPQINSVKLMCEKLEPFKDHMEFRFTIGSCNDYVLKFWEPKAPGFQERVFALAHAKHHGFRTSVSIEPMLDLSPAMLIDLIHPFVTGEIWIGTMNHIQKSDFSDDDMVMYNQIMAINSIQNIRVIYNEFKDHPQIRWKDSIQDLLGLP